MRLKIEQQKAICDVALQYCKSQLLGVYLFGSRTQDELKGGDIDLLFLVDESGLESIKQKLYAILNSLKKHTAIGDRRIDLHIATPADLERDTFLKSIKNSLMEIR